MDEKHQFNRIDSEQGFCPICKNELEYHAGYLHEAGDFVYEWKCKCGSSGEESYELVFDGHFNVVKQEEKQ